eukprot:COSAG01_NODE_8676_length_2701_cov_1.212529_3_plen_197_part_00
MSNTSIILLLNLFAYLIGSVPFGLIIAKFKNIDIRNTGSGNIGASNVFRVIGPFYGTCVFILDTAKGWLPTYLSIQVLPQQYWAHILIGAATVIGHSYTCFAKFKGGKGVATAAGMILALNPLIFAIVCPITLISIKITRYVAPCSMIACISIPILFKLLNGATPYILVTSILAVLIVWRHRSNIKRLLKGEENKI